MIDDKTFNQVAQLGHFAGGLAVVFGSEVLFGKKWGWLSFLILLAVAAIKEFWYDKYYETTEVRGSSSEDFTFYLIGGATALMLTLISDLVR